MENNKLAPPRQTLTLKSRVVQPIAPALDEKLAPVLSEEASVQTKGDHGEPYDHAAVCEQVAALWPHLFTPGKYVPLMVRIDKPLIADVRARGASLSWSKLKQFLNRYCKNPRYIACIAEGGARYGIEGPLADGGVTPEHAMEAKARLKAKAKKSKAVAVSANVGGDVATQLEILQP